MAGAMSQLIYTTRAAFHAQLSPSLPVSRHFIIITRDKEYKDRIFTLSKFNSHQNLIKVAKSSAGNDGIVAAYDDEDGVSLGTMKLPSNTDLDRFETLLFQWANSLCQGANLPLPMPLKVDKIDGGVRMGFITIGDGKTEVLVYIDLKVYPATADSGPLFRAIRNGTLKDKSPPGEPRIMRSLMQALQKSVQIAAV